MACTVADVIATMQERYPQEWVPSWDAVGLVLGEPAAPVERLLCAIDVVPEVVTEAADLGAQVNVSHHPLLLTGVTSVAPTTYKGRIVADLIRSGIALFVRTPTSPPTASTPRSPTSSD